MKAFIDMIIVLWVWALALGLGLLIVSAPTVAAYFVHRRLRNTKFRHVGLILLIAAPIWTSYEVYTAVYPTDSFYLSEFKDASFRDAPMSAEIVRKDATYPDFHGDYISVSFITMTDSDYARLLEEIRKDVRLASVRHEDLTCSRELDDILGDYTVKDLLHCFVRTSTELPDKSYMIGFVNDRRSVVVYVINI